MDQVVRVNKSRKLVPDPKKGNLSRRLNIFKMGKNKVGNSMVRNIEDGKLKLASSSFSCSYKVDGTAW
ncbi:hypothetical protein M8C21_010786, partial [Ambrosia artemisiifolia]